MVKKKSLNLRAPFCTFTFKSNFLITFLMYTLEGGGKGNTSLLCILCTLIPQIIPLLTLTLVRMLYEESTPHATLSY